MKKLVFIIICSGFLTISASPEIKLPRIFGSGMVMKQCKAIPVWGLASPGEMITVILASFIKPAEEPGESSRAELRKAQTMTLALPSTGMAVAIDIGEANDTHPLKKVEVFSQEVPLPVAVRFGWADNPDDMGQYNTAGLPANPFRTDSGD